MSHLLFLKWKHKNKWIKMKKKCNIFYGNAYMVIYFTQYILWNSSGQSTGMGSLSLLQGIFPTLGSNPGLLLCRWILFQLSHKGSPRILEWVAYPFSSGSSWPRNLTGVAYITGGFFTNWAISEDPLIKDLKIPASFSCIAWYVTIFSKFILLAILHYAVTFGKHLK